MSEPERQVEHPPLKLRSKRRVLFQDIRLPRRRPKSVPEDEPVQRVQPARLPEVAPPPAPVAEPPVAESIPAPVAVPPVADSIPAPVAAPPELVRPTVVVLDEVPASRPPSPRRAPRPDETDDAAGPDHADRAPLYWRLLRLRHIRPNGWLRAIFVEGSVALAVVLVLAEKANIWTIVVLPVLVAVLVKVNDVIAGALRRPG